MIHAALSYKILDKIGFKREKQIISIAQVLTKISQLLAAKVSGRENRLFQAKFSRSFKGRHSNGNVRVRILVGQPVSLRFGEYLSETPEIPTSWALSTLAQCLWMAEFRVFALKTPNRLPFLSRRLPFSGVALRRPKNIRTAR